MNKIIAIFLAAAALIALPQASHAQKATSKNNTVSGATADAAAVGAIFMPGAIGGAGAAGGAAAAASASSSNWNQPQLIMNSGSAPSTSTFNDCGVAFSGGLWVLTFSATTESASCVAQRQALLAMQMQNAPMAFERMCDVPEWRAAAERTNGPQCAASVAARLKAQPVVAAPAPVQPVRTAASSPCPNGIANQTTQRDGSTLITCQ